MPSKRSGTVKQEEQNNKLSNMSRITKRNGKKSQAKGVEQHVKQEELNNMSNKSSKTTSQTRGVEQ
jgi:hypothetical protein